MVPRTVVPYLDEHTECVYTTILGMSDEEFVEFLNDGVFQLKSA